MTYRGYNSTLLETSESISLMNPIAKSLFLNYTIICQLFESIFLVIRAYIRRKTNTLKRIHKKQKRLNTFDGNDCVSLAEMTDAFQVATLDGRQLPM